jgi:RNA polymerase sigma factor (sigma-70 family)
MRLNSAQAAALVHRAAAGEQSAWNRLVEEYAGLIWAITRSFRLSAAEAADVSQTTWLRLCENIERLREPGAVGAWLATTTRRECMNLQSHRRPVVLMDDMTDLQADSVTEEPPDAALLQREWDDALRDALSCLPARTQLMLRMLMADGHPSYEEVAAALELPIGSIGPTRGRALRRLKQILAADLEGAAPVPT